MLSSARERFLNYYNNELRYLRHAGKVFAKKYPKIARRLELGDTISPDPHTERLLESFAFMTARLSQEIDERFPELASTLLGILYPHLVNPLPSMAIAQFQVDLSKAKQTVGYSIHKATPLFTYTDQGITCRFQTVYPLTLWPISVKDVDFIPKETYILNSSLGEDRTTSWFLRLRLGIEGGLSWADLKPEELVFHLRGERILTLALYQNLFSQSAPRVFVSTDPQNAMALPLDSLQPLGFSRDETAIPTSAETTHAYQLLQEYFHLPEKFLFFKIQNLQKVPIANDRQTLDLLIPFSNVEDFLQKNISSQHFLLGCTPIINLFSKTTEPLRLTRRKVDYPLIPDQRRDKTTEIHSIQSVFATVEGDSKAQILPPYFSFQHDTHAENDTLYWVSKRLSSESRDVPGTDIHLSFVDLKFSPAVPPHHIIYAQALCTNRFLPEQLPYNAELQIEDTAPLKKVVCLDKPVPPVYSPTDGESLWRLVSQLSVNHLSLTGGQQSLALLKEALRLYAGTSYHAHQHEIDEIIDLQTRKITRRFGSQAWRGFVEGVEVALTLRPSLQTGHACFLLTSVLRHYLALNVHLNSFLEFVLKTEAKVSGNRQQHGMEWMRWQPLPGSKIQL